MCVQSKKEDVISEIYEPVRHTQNNHLHSSHDCKLTIFSEVLDNLRASI